MNARLAVSGVALAGLAACTVIVWIRTPAEVDPQLRAAAGTYVQGGSGWWSDGIRIDEDGRFERAFSGCTGGARYGGSATIEQGWLVLIPIPTLEDRWLAFRGVTGTALDQDPSRFRVVTWGERRYLIEETAMQGFCNFINQGREPRDGADGAFPLLEGGWLREPEGLPDVPPEWDDMLLRTDIESTIAELVNRRGAIEVGTEDGLREGMILIARDVPTPPEVIARGGPPTQDHPLVIAELHADHCLVAMQYPGNSPPLEVGMRVTSRAVDR